VQPGGGGNEDCFKTRLGGESLLFVLSRILRHGLRYRLSDRGNRGGYDQHAVPTALGEFHAMGGEVGEPGLAILLAGDVTEAIVAGGKIGAEQPPAVGLALHGEASTGPSGEVAGDPDLRGILTVEAELYVAASADGSVLTITLDVPDACHVTSPFVKMLEQRSCHAVISAPNRKRGSRSTAPNQCTQDVLNTIAIGFFGDWLQEAGGDFSGNRGKDHARGRLAARIKDVAMDGLVPIACANK
jgi:hypothetical protein